MKVRVCYTVEITPEFRAALAGYYGQKKISRNEIRGHYISNGFSVDDDIIDEHGHDEPYYNPLTGEREFPI